MSPFAKFVLRTRVAAAGALVFAAAALVAVAIEPPAALPGAAVIGAQQGKTLADLGAPLIDTRSPSEFAREHIPGATSLPHGADRTQQGGEQAAAYGVDLAQVAAGKDSPLVFYCGASECWTSYEAARLAVQAGYRQVHWLRGGLAAWRARDYPTTFAAPTRRSDREPSEMAQR